MYDVRILWIPALLNTGPEPSPDRQASVATTTLYDHCIITTRTGRITGLEIMLWMRLGRFMTPQAIDRGKS